MNVYNESHMFTKERKMSFKTESQNNYREVTEGWHLLVETNILVGKGHLAFGRWLQRLQDIKIKRNNDQREHVKL